MSLLSRFKKEKTSDEKALVPAIVEERKGKADAWRVLAHPIVSEKAAALGSLNQYVFAVHPNVTKPDIRRAVHDAYGVRPIRVNIVTVSGKWVTSGRSFGKTKHWKKAMVTLPKGKTIQVYEGV